MSLEKSYIGNTGFKRPVPKEGSSFYRNRPGINQNIPADKMILSEEEKKQDDYGIIKQIVRTYEEIGRRQIRANKDKIIKNQNVANGVIDKRDYTKGTELDDVFNMIDPNSTDQQMDINFYPFAPRIVNTLVSFLSKSKVTFQAVAVNREAQNEVLETKNNEIKNLLINKALQFYVNDLETKGVTEESNPDVFAEQMDLFQKLPKIQNYYSKEFRLTIEEWANHRIKNAKRKFDFDTLERQALRDKLITDRPYVHLKLQDDAVIPENIRPENAAFLRSPYKDDVSEGYMFMWYEYDSPTNLIQRFGSKMDENTIEKLKRRFLPTQFTATTRANFDYETSKPIESDIQNYLAFRSERDSFDRKYRGEEYRDNLVEVMNMYLQIPRKLYEVTIVSEEGFPLVTIVDDTYTPTISLKPVYMKGKPKEKEYLLYGEHIEPLYINELWQVVKINFSRNANPNLSEDAWVVLNKYPVQLSNPRLTRYGSLIPVHGGPTTNKYSETSQIIDKIKPFQILYNFVWNRIDEILQTEIGLFFLLNQQTIPSESLGGSWGKNNILKFLLTARDTGIGPLDLSPSNVGSMNQLTNGFGQLVDMNRGKELLEKIQIAEAIKREAFEVIGLSPQFLSDISPSETATGISQGIQRSVTAIKHIYDEHYNMMEKVWQTYLELSKYVAIQNGSVEETYVDGEDGRVIFQTSAADFPLYLLGVYTTSSFDDTLLLSEIQQMVKMDNTLGADVAEKVAMMSSESISEVNTKLKEIQLRKMQQLKEEQESEQNMMQQKIEAENMLKEKEIQWEREKLLLQLESEENIQEMKVIGQSNFAQGTGLDDLLKLKQSDLDERSYYTDLLNKAKENQLKGEEMNNRYSSMDKSYDQSKDLKEQELRLKREEIMARLKISENQLAIAKENKLPGEKSEPKSKPKSKSK